MRRPLLRLLLAGLLVFVLLPTGPASAGTEDLPPGFTDGVPVGGPNGPEGVAPGTVGPDSAPGTRASTPQRYFGADPWHAIEASASAAPRPCSITDTGVTALVTAPVFKESSAATSPSTAPSPMTLSRYDEWSGTYSTATNVDANYGLYAFRDPNTAYKRAYWHPGIGIWQYDTAGVGAPFTAIERMDVRTVSADVAKGMTARYCSPSASLIGHSAPFSASERRASAWAPWGYPCTLCEREFQAMTGGSTPFANITLVGGISVTGGAKARTCSILGSSGTVPCWYIDPSVGTIEGATGWATVTPDGGSPTVKPAPLAKPFYVLERNGREERHWLRADTGYSIDISASREIGKNDRPRSNQPGSGLTWVRSSGLCDLTAARGSCVPQPPAGVNVTTQTVNGTFRPISLDANGDDKGDILWFAPGATGDPLWLGTGSGGFTSTTRNIGGPFTDALPLDVDGNGRDDVLWYDRASGSSYLWRSNGDGTFATTKLSVAKGLRPLVLDRDGDGDDEIFWYGPGSAPDAWWTWNGSGFTVSPRSVSGSFLPFVGDFDDNGREDIFWYAPGPNADSVWLNRAGGGVLSVPETVGGLFLPQVGDFDGDGSVDVFWYAPGSAPDAVWFGGSGGRFARVSHTVTSTYQPVVADLKGDGRDDIVWYAPGVAHDTWWTWSSTRALSGGSVEADGHHQAIVGGFSTGGADGVFWYAPGSALDALWWR